MKDRYLITLEIETYDGDPKLWDWNYYLGDEFKIVSSEFKGRVLPKEGEEE